MAGRRATRPLPDRPLPDRPPDDRPLPDLVDGFLGPEVIDRKRLYHPDAAPINAPNASDWAYQKKAKETTSEVVVPWVVPVVLPAGLGDGEPATVDAFDAAEPLGATVSVAETLDRGEADAAAIGLEEAPGVGEERAIAPESVTWSVVTVITIRKMVVATNAARTPASQEAFGARKPAVIGGISGTGTNRNSAITVTNGSSVVPLLAIRLTMYAPPPRQMSKTGQIAFVPKTSHRISRRSSR